jgi:hypothetical protein
MVENIREAIKEEVNNQEVHNCLSCPHAFAGDIGIECWRRKSEGIVVALTEDQIFMNCAARDVETYPVGQLSDKYLEWMKEREYKSDLDLRNMAYEKDIVGGD